MNTTVESLEQQELAAAREQATRIIQLAVKDPSFRQKAVQDPEGVLRAFGLPEHAIATFIREGADHQALICYDTTCWISMCPGTCYVTEVEG